VIGHADGEALIVVDCGFGVDVQGSLEGVETVVEGSGFDAAAAEKTPVVLGDLVCEAVLLRSFGLVFVEDALDEGLVFGPVFVLEDDVFGGEAVLDRVLADVLAGGFAHRPSW
jgi:hypothetical protein